MKEFFLCPFHQLFPERAWKEYRVMRIVKHEVLPADEYGLTESYCVDPQCDCRRVMLNVVSRHGGRWLASISFGFDRDKEGAGPYLDPLNPQSEHAEALLEVIERQVLSDPGYVARLESHYRDVKEAVANPTLETLAVMDLLTVYHDEWEEEADDDDGEEELIAEEPWDQSFVDSVSFEEKKRIALDAMAFPDDNAFHTYAAEQGLTVNQIAYCLNAYESGGDAGLRAIGTPDIIPPALARRSIRTITKTLDEHFQGRVLYRITDEGTGIGVYAIQKRRHTGDEYLFPICLLRVTLSTNQWHLYWMRKFDAWWPYPTPEKGRRFSLNARLRQLLEDEYGCFWG